MNPENIQNNDDLAGYLVWLGKRLRDNGQSSLAEEVILASRFSSGSPSEFLHEAQTALQKVLYLKPPMFTDRDIQVVEAVINQIRVAFQKIGGA